MFLQPGNLSSWRPWTRPVRSIIKSLCFKGQGHFFILCKCHLSCKWIYESSCIWTVEKDMKRYKDYVHDHCSCTQLKQKNSGLNGIQTHDLCNTSSVLYQLSYQANWELVTLLVHNISIDNEECKCSVFSFMIFTALFVGFASGTVLFCSLESSSCSCSIKKLQLRQPCSSHQRKHNWHTCATGQKWNANFMHVHCLGHYISNLLKITCEVSLEL